MDENYFGVMLRASRMGYHWSAQHKAFVRISSLKEALWRVDVCPETALPPLDKVKEFVRWWENNEPNVLNYCEPLRGVCAPKEPYTFYADDDGKSVVLNKSKKRDRSERALVLQLSCGHTVKLITNYQGISKKRTKLIVKECGKDGIWCEACNDLSRATKCKGTCRVDEVEDDV